MSKTKAAKAAKKVGKGFLLPVTTGVTGGVVANQFPQNRRSSKAALGELKKMAYPFESEGPGFNHQAARAIYDIIAKMDDDSAQMFAEIVISDVLEAEIEKNLPTYQRHLDEVIAKRSKEISKQILKRSDDPNAKAYAEAIGVISKADWDADLHPRGRSGQFRTTIKHTQKKPLRPEHAKAIGINGVGTKAYNNLKTDEKKAQFQDEYRQIASFLDTVHSSTGGAGNTDIFYHVQDAGGNSYLEHRTDGGVPLNILYNPETKIVGVQAHPTTLTAGGAAFGLVPALSDNSVKGINATDAGFHDFASGWTAEGDNQNSNAQRYNRMAAGSKLLSQIGAATGNPKLLTAARVGEFVGSHGAEAEAVIGPSARKTAYRYRGTERTPDPDLVSTYGQAVRGAKRANAEEQGAGRQGRSQTAPSVSQMARNRVLSESRDPSQEEINYGVGAVGNYLKRNRVPSSDLYALQLASGNTPPSEGVMFDKEGRIVAQAVGYGDDHYLPFNLKNLKSLKGGQYVRTRSVGGPTSEDIYTGLVSGARRVTVVSRSGTFTVDFEDDFRGGRRHNDKARRMTRRYEQLLDAVQSEQVDHVGVPPSVRQAIETQVHQEAADWGDSPATIRSKIQQRIQEYKENPDLTPREKEHLEAKWRAASDNGQSRDAKKLRAEIFGSAMAAKEFKYKLNGNGYKAALSALEEQFPYYIKTDSNPNPDLDLFDPMVDRGYVEPGRNRPTAASAGLFGATRNHSHQGKGQKFSAAEADYQGVHAVRRGGSPSPVVAGERAADAGEGKEAPVSHEQQTGEIKRKIARTEAAVALRDDLKSRRERGKLDLEDDQNALLNLPDSEFSKEENLAAFDNLLRAYSNAGGQVDPTKRAAYEKAIGAQSREGWDPSALTWGKARLFEKGQGPYSPDAKYEDKLEEMKKRDAFSSISLDADDVSKKFSAMSEQEMEAEHSFLVSLLSHIKKYPGPISGEIKRDYGATKGASGLAGLDSEKDIRQRLENLHRTRALMTDMSSEDRARAANTLAHGAVVVRPEATTKEERDAGPMQLSGNYIRNAESAAAVFEERDDEESQDKAKELRIFASAMKDQQRDFKNAADVRRVMADNVEIQQLIDEGFERKYKKA